MLKLVLILLAFFVFLFSRSEFAERKVAPILDSLALRFAAPVTADGFAGIDAVARRGDPATLLRRRVLGHLPISAAPVEAPGAIIAFDLAEQTLFDIDRPSVARDRLVLLHRLAGAVAGDNETLPARLIVTTAWPPDGGEAAGDRFDALRAVFDDTALPIERLRFGFANLPPATWRFAIRSELPDGF
jgi:hypothetical protein